MVTMKTKTRTGQNAADGTEKQRKFANKILSGINTKLADVTKLGCINVADAVNEELDKLTDVVEAGPMDIIQYLGEVDVYHQCYMVARRLRDSKSVSLISSLL